MNYQQSIIETNRWIAKPLNLKGDLNSWVSRMKLACPNPKLNQVVWLEGNNKSIGYKVIGFKPNGEVIWQRGKVIRPLKLD
ncbi:hypothetical protein [Glaciecola sp. HTCC2999]|uniref:hypothetical protein n=1 Tax=Glaciecola sp. HTCC2999 TaxID=455436 RepID=UPI0000E0E5E5|nr:hypothetical protein [Glaciecola sp. HTCC2999]